MALVSAGENVCGETSVSVLEKAYRFLVREWPRSARTADSDQGFESQFRASMVRGAPDWRVSQNREMGLGGGLDTSSGILHEIDLVATNATSVAFFELKNRGVETGKNEVVVFFAKVLDYLAANADLASAELCPAFISTSGYDEHALGACLGLGIHPMGAELRPVPVLHRNIQRLCHELSSSTWLDAAFREDSSDTVARLRALVVSLDGSWFGSRIGRLSSDSISLRAALGEGVVAAARELRSLNAVFSELLRRWERLKSQTAS